MEYTPQDIGDINANLREYTPQDITDINVEMDESTGMRLISPAKGAVGVSTSPVLQWESFEGSPLIRVLVWDDDGSGVDGSVGQPNNLIIDAKIVGSATEYNIPEALQNDSWYHWRTVPTQDITPIVGDVIDEVTGVSISSGSTITEGLSRFFTITVEGTGNFSTDYTASIVSGAGTISQSGSQVQVTANANSHPGSIQFEINASDVTATRELTIEQSSTIEQDNSRAGDEESLRLIFEATQGQNLPVLNNTSEIPQIERRRNASFVIDGEIYNAFGGESSNVVEKYGAPGWTRNQGWSASSMNLSATIEGVTVENIDGELRVTELDIRTINAIGVLPEFPGLHKMWRFEVSQYDPDAPRVSDNASGQHTIVQRITGPLPESLGHTSCSHMMLASNGGGGPNAFTRRPEDRTETGENFKHGQVANKYTGGVPQSWQNLPLEYCDLYGQSSLWGFDGRLEPWMNNWPMKRFYIVGDGWSGNPGGWSGRITKAAIGSWVDCDVLYWLANPWSGLDEDAFEDWNNISRTYDIGGEPEWTDPFPDFSTNTIARRINFGGRGFEDQPYPEYIHNFTNLNEFLAEGLKFVYNKEYLPSFAAMMGTTSRIRFTNIGGDNNTEPPYRMNTKVFREDENVSGYFNNNIINFYILNSPGMGGEIPEGMEDWRRVRYLWMYNCDYVGNLPNGCPGYNSFNLRGISFNRNRLGPLFPTDNSTWELAGSNNFNGTVNISGQTITRVSGDDFTRSGVGDTIWIDFLPYTVESKASNQELTVTVAPPASSSPVPFINWNGFDGGRSSATVSLSSNIFEDVVPAVWANMRITGDIGIDVSDNKLTFQHLIHAPLFENNGKPWGLTYAPQKPFGKESDQSGNTIDLSAYHQSGNVYEWKRNGIVLSGETSHNITTSGVGNEYVCEVTNDIAPDLTLISITFNT